MNRKKALLILVLIMILIAGTYMLFFPNRSTTKKDENKTGEITYLSTSKEHIITINNLLKYADNELLVVINPAIPKSRVEALAKRYKARIVGQIEKTGDYQWQFEKSYTIEEIKQVADQIRHENEVEEVSLNYFMPANEQAINYGDEWREEFQDLYDCKGKNWGIEAIYAPAAWNHIENHKEKIQPVRVGLIDCTDGSFDINHRDLGFAQTLYQASIISDHGCHVAGTFAAVSDNAEGICGVYPFGRDQLYGVSLGGISNYPENIGLVEYKIALAELILRNVKVINMSIGIDFLKAGISWEGEDWVTWTGIVENNVSTLAGFLQRCIDQGYDFVIVKSAGNDSNRNPSIFGDNEYRLYDSKYNGEICAIGNDYPDIYNRIIVVGSINQNREISYFSNGGDRVDIYAPGEEIYSCIGNGKYGYKNGTSMAAPHVAGVAAMIWSCNNSLSGNDVKKIACESYYRNGNSPRIIDANHAVGTALNIDYLSSKTNPDNGSILGWVVSEKDPKTKVVDAIITATNVSNNEQAYGTTDEFGHFELIVPEGQYILHINATGYTDCIWPENGSIENSISVSNNGVIYLDDWIRMHTEAKTEGDISEQIITESRTPVPTVQITDNPPAYDGPFSIEGAWKNNGNETYGQVYSGSVVTFDGAHCNFISPYDTYSITKNGSGYTLTCSTYIFGQTLSFDVKVVNQNQIIIGGIRNPITLDRVN